ncbi:hypothetical protein D3C81_1027240 [compost metagenome]
MNTAAVLFTVVVYDVTLRILGLAGKYWLCSEDLAQILEYRAAGSITSVFSRHRAALEEFSLRARIDGEGHTVRLFDAYAVRYLCEYSKRPGAFYLKRWLEEGGMQHGQPPAAVQPPRAPVLTLVPNPTPPLPGDPQARTTAYCRALLKVLLRYATPTEAQHLVSVVEDEVQGLLNARYCQGLNDARYALFRRFWLHGGEQ